MFLNEANEELAECVALKKFAEAGKIQQKIDDAKLKKEALSEQLNPPSNEIEITVSMPEKVLSDMHV